MDNKLVDKFDKTQSEIAKVEAEIVNSTAKLQKQLTTLKEQDKNIRLAIKEAMEKHSVKKIETDRVAITYVAPSERRGLDVKKLKEEKPKVYEQYEKITNVSASIRIKEL